MGTDAQGRQGRSSCQHSAFAWGAYSLLAYDFGFLSFAGGDRSYSNLMELLLGVTLTLTNLREWTQQALRLHSYNFANLSKVARFIKNYSIYLVTPFRELKTSSSNIPSFSKKLTAFQMWMGDNWRTMKRSRSSYFSIFVICYEMLQMIFKVVDYYRLLYLQIWYHHRFCNIFENISISPRML